MDLWQMVLADHANIEELGREVLRATGTGPNSRAELFADLQDELERHISAKQTVLYPAMAGHERLQGYISELDQEHDDLQRRLDALAARPDKDSQSWATEFKEFMSILRHAFTLEENGVLIVAHGVFHPREAKALMRSYERERIASYEASRWHLPQSMMPSRYGLPTGMTFGILAGALAIGGAALAWSMSRQHATSGKPLRPVHRRPQPPFPLRSGVVDHSLSREGAYSSMARAGSAPAGDEARLHGTASPERAGRPGEEHWFSSANPPHAPSGIASNLQPGGVSPGGGPAASAGSIGTGGAQTENRDTGSLKRDGR